MKGIIWKYQATPDDPELRDGARRTGCRVLNPDPDFRENRFPVWAICGPRVRATLAKGDVLVFTPNAKACRAAKVARYLCTGYLIVKDILPNDKALLRDTRFTPRYRRNYRIDLRDHLTDDVKSTRKQRPQCIIIGTLIGHSGSDEVGQTSHPWSKRRKFEISVWTPGEYAILRVTRRKP